MTARGQAIKVIIKCYRQVKHMDMIYKDRLWQLYEYMEFIIFKIVYNMHIWQQAWASGAPWSKIATCCFMIYLNKHQCSPCQRTPVAGGRGTGSEVVWSGAQGQGELLRGSGAPPPRTGAPPAAPRRSLSSVTADAMGGDWVVTATRIVSKLIRIT